MFIFNFWLMKRKDFNLYKREIRRLLKQIDDSFVPNHVYDETSNILRDAANLRYVASLLCNDLIKLTK